VYFSSAAFAQTPFYQGKTITVIASTAAEVDTALLRGEVDGRANNASSVLRRNPEWFEKGVMDFHAILEAPRDPEVIDLLKALSGAGPLPAR
jgi:hypothetical protein